MPRKSDPTPPGREKPESNHFDKITAEGIRYYTRLHIASLKKEFETTGNPVFALHAFIAAANVKINPPQWLVRFIADGFGAFLDSGDPEALRNHFATTQGKSHTEAYLQAERMREDAGIGFFVHVLMVVFGVKANEAADMLENLLAKKPRGISPLKNRKIRAAYSLYRRNPATSEPGWVKDDLFVAGAVYVLRWIGNDLDKIRQRGSNHGKIKAARDRFVETHIKGTRHFDKL